MYGIAPVSASIPVHVQEINQWYSVSSSMTDQSFGKMRGSNTFATDGTFINP